MVPFRVYLITDLRVHGGDADALLRALEACLSVAPPGLAAVQLRERLLGGRAYAALASKVRGVTRVHDSQLFISDRVDVALACGADGVHTPRGGLTPEEVRRLGPALRVGVSTHSAAEVNEARAQGADVVVYGPIHAPQSKVSARPALGTSALAALPLRAPMAVFALGGIDASNAAECVRAGADGVACVSSVLGAADPAAAMRALLREVERGLEGRS